MAERDYSGELPTKPPEDIVPWLHSQGHFQTNLLIYKMDSYYDPLTDRRIKAVELHCTACDRQVFTEKVPGPAHIGYASASFGFVHPETQEHLISGNNCLCPECGAPVKVAHVGSIPHGSTVECCYPTTITRIDDKLTIIGWSIQKFISKTGEISYIQHGYEAYVVEEKCIVRLNAYRKFMSNISFGKWEQRKKYEDIWGCAALVYPWDSSLLVGSTAENSKLDILLRDTKKNGTYPVTYLRIWQKRPQIENLVVQGVSVLLSEMMDNERNGVSYEISVNKAFSREPFRGLVNWKEKSPAKMLGMTRDEFRRCVKGKWDTKILHFWQSEKERGRVLTDEEIKLANSIGLSECRWWLGKGLDWMKGARYINRQKAKDKRVDMTTYRDYWRSAEAIGEAMTLPAIHFPPNLMRAHDRVEGVRQWQEEAKKKAERDARAHPFEERYAELAPLAWEHDEILIRPVKDELELSREGKELHHCVGSYAQTHIKGDNPIFLVRRVDEPDKPWFTLQLNVKKLTVVQNRGLRNCDRAQEIIAFELRWIAHLRELESVKENKPRQRATKPKTEPRATGRQRVRAAV